MTAGIIEKLCFHYLNISPSSSISSVSAFSKRFDNAINPLMPGGSKVICTKLFHNRRSYHMESSPLICSENQWTNSFMIGNSVMKELNKPAAKSWRLFK